MAHHITRGQDFPVLHSLTFMISDLALDIFKEIKDCSYNTEPNITHLL
ncbi:MAG: hypothetical protein ACLFUO_03430 [Candidatus Woesearchaeota archaeon]